MAFTIIFGLVWILTGGYSVFSARPDLARRRRIRATPTSPISQATGGQAAIRGHIEAGEEGLKGPADCTGRPGAGRRLGTPAV
jgi:hypothetical protein